MIEAKYYDTQEKKYYYLYANNINELEIKLIKRTAGRRFIDEVVEYRNNGVIMGYTDLYCLKKDFLRGFINEMGRARNKEELEKIRIRCESFFSGRYGRHENIIEELGLYVRYAKVCLDLEIIPQWL